MHRHGQVQMRMQVHLPAHRHHQGTVNAGAADGVQVQGQIGLDGDIGLQRHQQVDRQIHRDWRQPRAHRHQHVHHRVHRHQLVKVDVGAHVGKRVHVHARLHGALNLRLQVLVEVQGPIGVKVQGGGQLLMRLHQGLQILGQAQTHRLAMQGDVHGHVLVKPPNGGPHHRAPQQEAACQHPPQPGSRHRLAPATDRLGLLGCLRPHAAVHAQGRADSHAGRGPRHDKPTASNGTVMSSCDSPTSMRGWVKCRLASMGRVRGKDSDS